MWPFKKRLKSAKDLPARDLWSMGTLEENGTLTIISVNRDFLEFDLGAEFPNQIGIAIPRKSVEVMTEQFRSDSVDFGQIGDSLIESFTKDNLSVFVATLASDSMKEWVFYTRDVNSVRSLFAEQQERYSYHDLQLVVQEDESWSVFKNLVPR